MKNSLAGETACPTPRLQMLNIMGGAGGFACVAFYA